VKRYQDEWQKPRWAIPSVSVWSLMMNRFTESGSFFSGKQQKGGMTHDEKICCAGTLLCILLCDDSGSLGG
jgi:hypothetical protein